MVPFISDVTSTLFLHTVLCFVLQSFDMKLRENLKPSWRHPQMMYFMLRLVMCVNKASCAGGVVVRKLVSCEHRKRTATTYDGWLELKNNNSENTYIWIPNRKRLKYSALFLNRRFFSRNDWFKVFDQFYYGSLSVFCANKKKITKMLEYRSNFANTFRIPLLLN